MSGTSLYRILLIAVVVGSPAAGYAEPVSGRTALGDTSGTCDTVLLRFARGPRVVVLFRATSFTVLQITGSESTAVSIPFAVDEDKRVECRHCIRVTSAARDTFVSAFYLGDSLLLLPVLDFSGKLRLFGIDFESRKRRTSDGLADVHLVTTLDAFLLSLGERTLTTTDGIEYDEDGRASPVAVHVWQISGTSLAIKRHSRIAVPRSISNMDSIRVFLMDSISGRRR